MAAYPTHAAERPAWLRGYATGRLQVVPFTPDDTKGVGIIVGYAIDASTLGTTNRLVGLLAITFRRQDRKLLPIRTSPAPLAGLVCHLMVR